MHAITPSPDRTTTTPNAVMTHLAAPSVGSAELSTWRVRMEAGAAGPEHVMDREQVWTVLSGALSFTADGTTTTVPSGGAAILPPGVSRQVRAADDAGAEAIVAMRADGQVSIPGQPGSRALPWAV
ncbi:cupin domain-containing protein [Streptomyces mobaraensis]|uniref:cupin domain-containing protein n=1 Tax=Streptomyces mobaraensis TaxID=35621 RepID=UPI003318754F